MNIDEIGWVSQSFSRLLSLAFEEAPHRPAVLGNFQLFGQGFIGKMFHRTLASSRYVQAYPLFRYVQMLEPFGVCVGAHFAIWIAGSLAKDQLG